MKTAIIIQPIGIAPKICQGKIGFIIGGGGVIGWPDADGIAMKACVVMKIDKQGIGIGSGCFDMIAGASFTQVIFLQQVKNGKAADQYNAQKADGHQQFNQTEPLYQMLI